MHTKLYSVTVKKLYPFTSEQIKLVCTSMKNKRIVLDGCNENKRLPTNVFLLSDQHHSTESVHSQVYF